MSAVQFPETLEEAVALIEERGRSAPRTAILIYHLLRRAGSRGMGVYECYREIRRIYEEHGLGLRPPPYTAVMKMFYFLRRLGLIEYAGSEPGSHPWALPINRYRLTERGLRERSMWLNPKRFYRPGGGAAAPQPPSGPRPPPPEERPKKRKRARRARRRKKERKGPRYEWRYYYDNLDMVTRDNMGEWLEGLWPGMREQPLRILRRIIELADERGGVFEELLDRVAELLEKDRVALDRLYEQMGELGLVYGREFSPRDLIDILRYAFE
ncbi:MAG: hypothetical protein DRJ67_07315 [Thermoprotei archaeon]|nr:MAG: hypothetical protein DRJ67_07315 [Thermoprotei archaeon]